MTATATERRIENLGGAIHTARHGVLKCLRAASWKRGWLIVAHGLAGTGDRLMPYPTGGYNSAVTAVNGGPLQVAGADANGGLRFIAKKPNVRIGIGTSGTGTDVLTIVVTYGASTTDIAVTLGSNTTALTARNEILGNAEARALLDVAFSGTGASVVGTASTSAVPYVRIYGIAGGEADNSADSSNDAAITSCSTTDQNFYGRFGMLIDGSSPTILAPQKVYVVDNQTVTGIATPLCLPLFCSSYEDDMAICEIK